MQNFSAVLGFAWTYLRRYRGRLAASVLFAILFAIANACFIPAARTLLDRFEKKRPRAQVSLVTLSSSSPQTVLVPFVVAAGSAQAGSDFVPTNGTLVFINAETNKVLRVSVVGDGVHESAVKAASADAEDSWFTRAKARGAEFNKRFQAAVDPWLPRLNQPLTSRQILGMLFFLPALVLIRAGSDYLGNYCVGWVSERVIRDLRLDIMEKLSSLSLDFFGRWSTGDLLTRINSDTANLLRALRTGGADIVKEPLTMLVMLGVLIAIDPLLTLYTLVLLPAVMLPLFVLGRKARRATKAGLKASVSQSGQLVELLASIRIVKAFGLESAQLARFRKTSGQMVHAGMQGVKAKELVNPLIEVVTVFGLGALFLYVFWSGRNGKELVSFLIALMMLYLPVKKLAGLHILFEQAGVGVLRLKEILAEQPSVQDPPQPKPMSPFAGEIRFENVGFGYREKQVLHDFSLVIPRGFRLGLAGESGSGKTTLLNLLFRFYDPGSGSVKIDGVNLRDLALHDLRSQMALVSQDTVLFDDTVAGNIGAGKTGASREEIERAARAASAHDFITQLPRGYDTPIGERGGTLSGGQRQRLAIARAFVRDAPILVLDEATASLDSKTEAEVQATIEALAEHRTVICVAHRLSTLASMDKILVLAEGRMVEQGTFSELLKNNGTFTEMARRQGIVLMKNAE